MQDALIVHVEDGKSNLGSPVYDFLLLQLASLMFLFLGDDQLIEVSSYTKLHDDVEFLSFDDGLSIGDNVDVFELFE